MPSQKGKRTESQRRKKKSEESDASEEEKEQEHEEEVEEEETKKKSAAGKKGSQKKKAPAGKKQTKKAKEESEEEEDAASSSEDEKKKKSKEEDEEEKKKKEEETVAAEGFLDTERVTTRSELTKRLKLAHDHLSRVSQENKIQKDALASYLAKDLVKPELLAHKDNDIRLLVACCISDLIRIYAPDPPFSEAQLPSIFELFFKELKGVEDKEDMNFTLRFYLLEKLALVKAFILLLDISWEIVVQAFSSVYALVKPDTPKNVLEHLLDLLQSCLEEAEELGHPGVMEAILLPMILPAKRDKPEVAAFSASLVKRCPDRIKKEFTQLYKDSLQAQEQQEDKEKGDKEMAGNVGVYGASPLASKCLELIHELNKVDTQVLAAVLPMLDLELRSDSDARRKPVVDLLARMFAAEGSKLHAEFRPLFNVFLGRFNDKVPVIRSALLSFAKHFASRHPDDTETLTTVAKELAHRLIDPDEKVRAAAVSAVCDLWNEHDVEILDPSVISSAADRMKDKKSSVRGVAIPKLSAVYRKQMNSGVAKSAIPTDIKTLANRVMCCYMLDIQEKKEEVKLSVEEALENELLPELKDGEDEHQEERGKAFIALVNSLDEHGLLALQQLLKEKRSLQDQVAALIAARAARKEKSDDEEIHKRVDLIASKVPVSGARDLLRRLAESKDTKPFKQLAVLINPGSTIPEILAARETFTKCGGKSGEDVCRALGLRLSSTITSSKEALKSLAGDHTRSCVSLLGSILQLYPALAAGVLPDVAKLADSAEGELSDQALLTLSKAITFEAVEKHPSLAKKLKKSMENLSTTGTPRQAKHAVRVLSRLTDKPEESLNSVAEELVGKLDLSDKSLPATLKALSQVATSAPKLVLEHIDTLNEFLDKVLAATSSTFSDSKKPSRKDKERLTESKKNAIELLVNVLLSKKDASSKQFQAILNYATGSVLPDDAATDEDESLLKKIRLEAAVGVARLAGAREYDLAIDPETFQKIAWTGADPDPDLRDGFLEQVTEGLMGLKLPIRYLAILALLPSDSRKESLATARTRIMQCIQKRRSFLRKLAAENSTAPTFQVIPEHAVPFLISLLAHSPEFPDGPLEKFSAESYPESIHALGLLLVPLLQSSKESGDSFSFLEELLTFARATEDARVPPRTKVMHCLCDLSRSLIRKAAQQHLTAWNPEKIGSAPSNVFLPPSLFKVPEQKAGGADEPESQGDVPPSLPGSLPKLLATPKHPAPKTPAPKKPVAASTASAAPKTNKKKPSPAKPSPVLESPSRKMPSRSAKKDVEYAEKEEEDEEVARKKDEKEEAEAKKTKAAKKAKKDESEEEEDSESSYDEKEERTKKSKAAASTPKKTPAKRKREESKEDEEEPAAKKSKTSPKKTNSPGKKGTTSRMKASDDEEEEEEEDPVPSKKGKKRAAAEESSSEEEGEKAGKKRKAEAEPAAEETTTTTGRPRRQAAVAAASKMATPSKPSKASSQKEEEEEEEDPSPRKRSKKHI